MWQCPLCKSPFHTSSNAQMWQCDNNHSFDRAKQGYFNLLPVQHKKSKHPGDDVGMIKARSLFFRDEPYKNLAKQVASIITEHASDLTKKQTSLVGDEKGNKNTDTDIDKVPHNQCKQINIYDSGCGEGFYMASVSSCLDGRFHFNGHDISKPAVIAAAKRNKEHQVVVASTINIPVQTASQDVIYQIFAPSSANEYARILKADGLLIIVEPAANHLIELKHKIYDEAKMHSAEVHELSGFVLKESQEITFQVALHTQEQRLALLQMTPYYWSASVEAKKEISESLTSVTAHFHIQTFVTSGPASTVIEPTKDD